MRTLQRADIEDMTGLPKDKITYLLQTYGHQTGVGTRWVISDAVFDNLEAEGVIDRLRMTKRELERSKMNELCTAIDNLVGYLDIFRINNPKEWEILVMAEKGLPYYYKYTKDKKRRFKLI